MKKENIKIAKMIGELYEKSNEHHALLVAEFADEVASYLAKDKTFDRQDFYSYCGIIMPEQADKNAIS